MREIEPGIVDWAQELWKYFKADRFLQLLDTRQLHFAAANQFLDPFEGAVAVQLNAPPPDARYAEYEGAEQAFRELKSLTKISCWHMASYESDAMWKLYAGEHKGIAVCTTPERMRDAFRPFRLQPEFGVEDMWGGPVTYVDLCQVRLQVPMLNRFFNKHRAFEWEKEFRLAISVRMAEEWGVQVPENGILVDVDLDRLVERVVIGSTLSLDERDAVEAQVRLAGFGDRLERSSLLGRPRYV